MCCICIYRISCNNDIKHYCLEQTISPCHVAKVIQVPLLTNSIMRAQVKCHNTQNQHNSCLFPTGESFFPFSSCTMLFSESTELPLWLAVKLTGRLVFLPYDRRLGFHVFLSSCSLKTCGISSRLRSMHGVLETSSEWSLAKSFEDGAGIGPVLGVLGVADSRGLRHRGPPHEDSRGREPSS